MASFARMGQEIPVAPVPASWQEQDWAERLEKTIERGANHLLSVQAAEGYWQGELEADTTLESDYIYYLHVLGKADPERIGKLANYVRRRQLADGGWSIYPGGPSERSEEHTSELQSQSNLVCRLLLEKKKNRDYCQSQRSLVLL